MCKRYQKSTLEAYNVSSQELEVNANVVFDSYVKTGCSIKPLGATSIQLKQGFYQIFDEFYRVDTGNIHTVKGHGLGLHYVKQVVDFHHGKITVESKLGEGTNFIISLPLKKINTN